MTKERLYHTIRLYMIRSSKDRVAYMRKKKIFKEIGDNVTIMDRKVPLYAKLIRIHNNVRIASNVTFITHDITHFMLNKRSESDGKYNEIIGCIEIMDNVFIGSNVSILSNVRIGSNVIVAAGAVVIEDVPSNSVIGGVPAKVLCTFDDYLSRRENVYPDELSPKNQNVSEDLVDFMWEDFLKQRETYIL